MRRRERALQEERNEPARIGNARKKRADAQGQLPIPASSLAQRRQAEIGKDRLALRAAQIRLQRVAQAPVRVLIRAQRLRDARRIPPIKAHAENPSL
jgi:hypothetical protein